MALLRRLTAPVATAMLACTMATSSAWSQSDGTAADDGAPLRLTPRGAEQRALRQSDRLVPPPPGSARGVIEVDRINGPRYRGPTQDNSGRLSLGPDPWADTPPALAEALLRQLPIGAPSPVMGELMRAVLLAPGPADGRRTPYTAAGADRRPARDDADAAFLTLRLARLQDAGHIEDAALLAAQVTAADLGDHVATRIQAVAALLDGESAEACALGLRMRLETVDPFWVKLRTFCYLLDDAAPAAELTARILAERGVDAPLFQALVGVMTGRGGVPDSAWDVPLSALDYAMVRAAGLPLPARAIGGAEPAVLRAVAMDIEPVDADAGPVALDHGAYLLALEAAERSVLTGALEPAALAHAYRQAPHTDAARADPLALMERMAPSAANALFFQVIERETIPASRVELLAASLAQARASGSGLPLSLVYGDFIAGISPTPDLAWAAGDLGLAALVAGLPDAAARWRDVLARRLDRQPAAPTREALRQLDAALLVAAPRPGGRVLDMAAWVAEAGNAPGAPVLQQDLALLGALGTPLDTPARVWLLGRRDPGDGGGASAALDDMRTAAVADGRVAEAVCLAMIQIGREGPSALSVRPTLSAIRTLAGLGMEDIARRLALESLLARPLATRAGPEDPYGMAGDIDRRPVAQAGPGD